MSKGRVEDWLDLEKLAARIYAELEPGSTVQHDVKLPGALTEIPRQIDVLVENKALGTRVVVDCKDRSRRVSVPDAHAFAGLLEDVGATSGVLICNRGFSKATATLARVKGFQLAKLHDVESRKWRLDVRVPIVWTRMTLLDMAFGLRARLDKGDVIETETPPRLLKNGADVSITGFFEEAWNQGGLHPGGAGEGELTAQLDWELASGKLIRDVDVTIHYVVGAASKLGYVTPQEARGIFDQETQAFTTVHFDVGKTVDQEPEGGWQDVVNPAELAISLAGTVVTMDETAGVEAVAIGPADWVRGMEPANAQFVWKRAAKKPA